MLTKREFDLLFKTFDQGLARKKKLPDFDPDKVQYWFKPMICLYMFAGLRKHEAGFSTAEAAFLAGHSTQRVTEKYIHLTAKNMKNKMDMVDL